ncbi:MAG: NFACT RNA binding domain-containing protein [Acidobacteriota bacterium]
MNTRRSPEDSPPVTDREQGLYRGRRVARRFVSKDGWIVLVGKNAGDNDVVTFKLGRPYDFWLHVAAGPGSHVVALNDARESRMPKETERLAAGLAAGYSSERRGGRVSVHVVRCGEVSKPRGAAAGKVAIARPKKVQAQPLREEDL